MKSLILGNGKSEVNIAHLLAAKGVISVIFLAGDNMALARQYPEETIIFSDYIPGEVAAELSEVIVTNGISPDCEFVSNLRASGYKIIGETEASYRYDKGTLLAVTGTNGKTTTTALLGKIIKDRVRNTFIVCSSENSSNSYAETVLSTTKDSKTVLEISNSQLGMSSSIHPVVSAILNITCDHVFTTDGMRKYVEEKLQITRNQTLEDWVILNYDDDLLRQFGAELDERKCGPRPFFFSGSRNLKNGICIEDNIIVLKEEGASRRILPASELTIIGQHNIENAMAAVGMAIKFGIPIESITKSLKEFKPVAHRIEFVAEKKGVKYFNDSNGTNVTAAIKGINAMTSPTYLIGGGYDKGAVFDDWIDSFRGKVRKLVLIGQTKDKIASCAKEHGFNDYVFAQTLDEAVCLCASLADPGDNVLLSPACASFGMFKNYEERGDRFRAIVESL